MSTNENKSMKSLRERAKEFDVRLPFMEGRDKGDTKDLIGQDSTIVDYGFLPNDQGEVSSSRRDPVSFTLAVPS